MLKHWKSSQEHAVEWLSHTSRFWCCDIKFCQLCPKMLFLSYQATSRRQSSFFMPLFAYFINFSCLNNKTILVTPVRASMLVTFLFVIYMSTSLVTQIFYVCHANILHYDTIFTSHDSLTQVTNPVDSHCISLVPSSKDPSHQRTPAITMWSQHLAWFTRSELPHSFLS